MNNRRVLIVDDEMRLRSTLKLEFELNDWLVTEAESARRAEELIRSNDYDLVVTDNRMPGGSGVDLIMATRESRKDLPMILMSAFSDLSWEEVLDHGADTFLVKPFPMKSIIETANTLTTPLEELLATEIKAVPDKKLQIEFESVIKSGIQGRLRFGRRGFFVGVDRDFPMEGEEIHFQFNFRQGELKEFAGIGRVEWVRSSANSASGTLLPAGIGVSLVSLFPDSLKPFLTLHGRTSLRASVPKA